MNIEELVTALQRLQALPERLRYLGEAAPRYDLERAYKQAAQMIEDTLKGKK